MQINIDDLEAVTAAAIAFMKVEDVVSGINFGSGSRIALYSAEEYLIGNLEFDGNFWTFDPEGYGKSID